MCRVAGGNRKKPKTAVVTLNHLKQRLLYDLILYKQALIFISFMSGISRGVLRDLWGCVEGSRGGEGATSSQDAG